ncbi:GGDEF domain-containing protein [Occallatibacter savannae]|uniref:GGDEF domain-containing protein n=1 Tax=Occallatibacter savannae TaxID=1002691 RepID=UPI000D689C1E|nr:GGDEF domain-containing protein [Occallatibacter savannae]
MLLSRDELIRTAFRETDRAQRMKTALSIILCGIDGLMRGRTALDERKLVLVEEQLSARVLRVLRCYDAAGWYGPEVLGLILPGCNSFSAFAMAERLNSVVFGAEFRAGDEDLVLTACFGVAGSGGRSPLVVMRNAEAALNKAKEIGQGAIERSSYDAEPDPATLRMPIMNELSSF